MKKRVIALMLSFAIAAGGIGSTSVFAAETTAQEANEVAQEEETVEQETLAGNEEADVGVPAEDFSEEEPAQVAEEDLSEVTEPEQAEDEQEAVKDSEEVEESTEDGTEETVVFSIEDLSVQEKDEETIIIDESEQVEDDRETVSDSDDENVAQAIWTYWNTLTFYYGPLLSEGDDFRGETVAGVWSGTDVTDSNGPIWNKDRVYFNESICGWVTLSVSKNVKQVVFDPSFLAVKPTNTKNWFASYNELESVDFSGLDTSNVTDMAGMFFACKSLTSLDVSGFDTSNVTDMGAMFCDCCNLESLDVSGFDTSNVTNMYNMFSMCYDLESLDVSSFDTSNVTDMGRMFESSSSLTSLDVSGFDISNVTDMRMMFYGCSDLKTIYCANNTTDWSETFWGWGTELFSKCEVLFGEGPDVNVSYDENKTDVSMAKSATLGGYFTPKVILCETHSWNESYTIDKEATCTENGSRKKTCKVCGYELSEDIPSIGHDWGEWTVVKEATEEEEGLETRTCHNDETHKEERAIPKLSHIHELVKTEAKAATCIEDGNSEYWTCSECGGVFSDSEGTNEISLENTVIYAIGHVWETEYTVDKEPTVTEEGSKSIHCGACDAIKEGSEVSIPKLNPLGKTTRGDMFNLANNVKVTWKAVPGAKYYKVYRSGVKDPVIVTTGLVGWDKTAGLLNGQKYTYKIVASMTGKGDTSGDSKLSYSKIMYRLKTVVIRSAKNTAPGEVTVKYDKTTSGDSYVLQYSDNKDMKNAKTKVVLGANNTSYALKGLKKGKTYYVSIRVRKKVNGIDYYTTFGVPKKVKVEK